MGKVSKARAGTIGFAIDARTQTILANVLGIWLEKHIGATISLAISIHRKFRRGIFDSDKIN